MVFVTVRDDDAPQAVELIQQIRDVRDYEVDTEHAALGEHHAGINHDEVVATVNGPSCCGHLTYSTERHNLYAIRHTLSPTIGVTAIHYMPRPASGAHSAPDHSHTRLVSTRQNGPPTLDWAVFAAAACAYSAMTVEWG